MRHPLSPGLGLILAAGLVSACIPQRNNPHDSAVRVTARIVVRVDGIERSIAGRGHSWELDASASDSPKSTVREWRWRLADRAADDPEDDSIVWLEVGAAERIASSTTATHFSQALRDRLMEIEDFGPTGQGITTRFVRLDVEDGDGRKDVEFARITVENHAPVVSLGEDLRISPGGEWWTLAAGADIFGAPPHTVTLSLRIEDVDGDEERAASESAPARWRVFGALAPVLDADLDGFVDDVNFGTDLAHRSLTFAAPIAASRNSFEVEVSDVGSVSAGGVVNAMADVRVDVLSNAWVYDRITARFTRLDTTRHSVPIVPETIPLAADGAVALLAEQGGSKLNLRVVDQTLRDVRRLDTVGFDAMAYVNATSDGAGGWWVVQGGAGADMGNLRHYSPSGASTLVLDRTVTSVEGGATSEFISAVQVPIASTLDGSKDVWVVGQVDGAGAQRLYRISTAGTVLQAVDAPSVASIVSDGAGGLWASSTNAGVPHVSRLDAAGASVLEFDVPAGGLGPPILSYDVPRGLLWMAMGAGNTQYLSVRTRDGVILTTPFQDPYELLADPADGTVLIRSNDSVYWRFGISADGAALEARETIVPGQVNFSRAVVLQGGSVLLRSRDALDANPRLVWIEAGTNSPTVSFSIPGAASEAAFLRFAVDPRTGNLWTYRPFAGRVDVIAPTGAPVRSVQVTPAVPEGGGGYVAIDPETRTAWVAWTSDQVGTLSSFSMDALDPVVANAPGVSFTAINDLAVVPGGPVCLAAGSDAFLYDPITQTTTTPVTISGSFNAVAVDVPSGASWYFSGFGTTVVRLSSTGAATTFTNPINPGTGASLIALSRPGVAPWSGIAYVPDTHFFGGSTSNWLTRFGPGTTGIAAATATLTPGQPNSFVVFPRAVVPDPFYRHLWMSFGEDSLSSPGAPPPGTVLRLDRNLVEVGRESGFLEPHLRGTH